MLDFSFIFHSFYTLQARSPNTYFIIFIINSISIPYMYIFITFFFIFIALCETFYNFYILILVYVHSFIKKTRFSAEKYDSYIRSQLVASGRIIHYTRRRRWMMVGLDFVSFLAIPYTCRCQKLSIYSGLCQRDDLDLVMLMAI